METTLFRHYKNKPYKLLHVVRHSETREELAVYETLYESPGGRLWARPKDMFFGNVEVDGKSTPRFARVAVDFDESTELDGARVAAIGELARRCLGEWDEARFRSRLGAVNKLYLIMAKVGGEAAGFKLGYAESATEFYSWLGGVAPEYRGVGIAAELMRRQHERCRAQGYEKIRTKTQNRFRGMLALNVKSGYDVVGVHACESGGIKIMLEKVL